MIKFKYSKKQEIKDLLWLYSEAEFFSKNKYKVFYPEIPQNIVKALEKNSKNKLNILELKNQFKPIFEGERSIYQETLEKIEPKWQKIQAPFFDFLKQNLDCKNSYNCFISRYGPGGTFYRPNSISIRVRLDKKDDLDDANEKIVHEIVHLCIYDLAEKYKLNFEDTERLVDLILTKTEIKDLLKNPKMQNFGNPDLDQIFVKNNFDIKKSLKEFTS